MSHIEDNKEKKLKSSHSKTYGHYHSHSHHKSSSKHYSKKEYDPSSEMERRGQNIIYDNVRKERIKQMIKRSIFVIVAITTLLVIFFFMTLPSESTLHLINRNTSKEEVNVLKNKIIDYEYHIKELEERLSKYENVESIFEKK